MRNALVTIGIDFIARTPLEAYDVEDLQRVKISDTERHDASDSRASHIVRE
jgi:hypothetical protein